MAAPKGHERYGGRQKGAINKNTAELKNMILQALDKAGGVDYLEQQATLNPASFMTLIGKVLPLQVHGDSENPLQMKISHDFGSRAIDLINKIRNQQ
jgi:hypothetical protein